MRFTTKTEYGLVCLVFMARQENGTTFTVKDIVQNEQMSVTYIEKIFQQLRAANIVTSHQGKQGGYALAHSPKEITLREIIEALEGHTFDVFCAPDIRKEIVCTHFPACGVRPIWQRTKDILDQFYGSVTLEMIARGEKELERALSITQV